jgi:hypothetical protein
MAGTPPPDWVAPYIGLPWKTMGRDREGLDCWGLVRLVFLERWSIALPAHSTCGWNSQMRPRDALLLARTIERSIGEDWKPVAWVGRREFDAVRLLVQGQPLHIGLIVSPEWFLHIQAGHDAAVERFDSMIWRDRVHGVYRHRDVF